MSCQSRQKSFRQQLADRDLGFGATARKLYDLLLKPAEELLRGKSNLVITPDDKLWELPFQSLIATDGQYVIEKASVSYAPSLTVLRDMKAQRSRNERGHGARCHRAIHCSRLVIRSLENRR